MLISILRQGAGAGELSGLLGLSADKVTRFELPFGSLNAFFPVNEAKISECSLLLELAPERLPREAPYLGSGHPLQAYVHDRVYTTSSLMAVALSKAFGKLLEADASPTLELELHLTALESSISRAAVTEWFVALGYDVAFLENEFSENATGEFPSDLLLKCDLPLPTILWHLQGLLVALDQDHVHWIGRDDTLAIANAALPWLETHPQGEAIKAAILGMPHTGKRNSRMNLVEPHDHFGPTPPRNFYRNAVEAVELSQTIAKLILAKGQKSAMIVMPEGNGLAEALAASDQIQQILLIDLETEHLQALARTVGQSALSIDQKRKFNLLTASPLYHGSHLKGPDAVILEGLLEKLPEHTWSAMASTLFLHGQPKMVVAVEPMGKPFKAWAEAVAKEYNFQLEFQTPKISDPAKAVPLGLAIFTAHSHN